MTTKKKLEKYRYDRGYAFMESFKRGTQNNHLHPWVASRRGFEGGVDALAPTWLKMYQAVKITQTTLNEIEDADEMDSQDIEDLLTCFKSLCKALTEADKFLDWM